MSKFDDKKLTRREVIAKIAKDLAGPSEIGARASLRRLKYYAPDQPAFWKIVVRDLNRPGFIADLDPWRGRDERRWAVIVAGLAEVVGADLHRTGRRLGEAAAAGKQPALHEQRLIKLLRAHGDALLDLIQPVAHQLVARGEAVDWADMAELVFSDGEHDEDRTRRYIAQTYFATLHKHSTNAQEPTA